MPFTKTEKNTGEVGRARENQEFLFVVPTLGCLLDIQGSDTQESGWYIKLRNLMKSPRENKIEEKKEEG